MDVWCVCVRLLCVCVVLHLGRGVLPIVYRPKVKWKWKTLDTVKVRYKRKGYKIYFMALLYNLANGTSQVARFNGWATLFVSEDHFNCVTWKLLVQ
jgi:hypothetical protein